MLMAAALPLALAFGGVSVWGIAQKHQAEDLAAAVAQKEREIARLAASIKQSDEHAPVLAGHPPAPRPLLGPARPQPKGKELVIPVENPTGPLPQDTQQVKAH